MRRLTCAAAAVRLVSTGGVALGSAPGTINLQGVLRADAGGLEDGLFNFEVQFFADSSTTTPFLDENYTSVQVDSGVFSLTVGGNTPTLAAGLASATAAQVVISVDGVAMPKQPLSSVAYAMFAQITSRASLADSVPFSGITGFPAACGANTFLTGFSAGGSAMCVTDSTIQRRTVAPTCASGYLRSIAADGTPNCQPDANSGGTVTSVTAGAGLNGGTITTTGTIDVSFGGTGTATQVSRSDHKHTFSCTRQSATGTGSASATCPAGSVVTGGGCNGNGNAVEQTAPTLALDGWNCKGANATVTVTASAVCCSTTVQ